MHHINELKDFEIETLLKHELSSKGISQTKIYDDIILVRQDYNLFKISIGNKSNEVFTEFKIDAQFSHQILSMCQQYYIELDFNISNILTINFETKQMQNSKIPIQLRPTAFLELNNSIIILSYGILFKLSLDVYENKLEYQFDEICNHVDTNNLFSSSNCEVSSIFNNHIITTSLENNKQTSHSTLLQAAPTYKLSDKQFIQIIGKRIVVANIDSQYIYTQSLYKSHIDINNYYQCTPSFKDNIIAITSRDGVLEVNILYGLEIVKLTAEYQLPVLKSNKANLILSSSSGNFNTQCSQKLVKLSQQYDIKQLFQKMDIERLQNSSLFDFSAHEEGVLSLTNKMFDKEQINNLVQDVIQEQEANACEYERIVQEQQSEIERLQQESDEHTKKNELLQSKYENIKAEAKQISQNLSNLSIVIEKQREKFRVLEQNVDESLKEITKVREQMVKNEQKQYENIQEMGENVPNTEEKLEVERKNEGLANSNNNDEIQLELNKYKEENKELKNKIAALQNYFERKKNRDAEMAAQLGDVVGMCGVNNGCVRNQKENRADGVVPKSATQTPKLRAEKIVHQAKE